MRTASGIVVIAFIAAASACSRGAKSEDAPADGTAIPVTTVGVEVGTITAVIQAAGLVTAAPGAEQIVTAPEQARIVEMPKGEGEMVQRGDLLVRFEIPSVESENAKGNVEVARAEARLDSARVAHARARDLFDKGVIPRVQVEDAESQIAAAEAELRAAKAIAAAGQAGLVPRTMVRALFDGIINQKLRDVGDIVAPGTSAILSVIDPTRLEITASMPFAEAIRIGIGNVARIPTPPEGMSVSPLHVLARPDSVAERSTPVQVRLGFDAGTSIPIGSGVQLAINAETHEAVLLVPLAAIVQEGDVTTVFVVNNGTVEKRAVTVGIYNAERAEITSGLQQGETIAIDSANALSDGARVVARPAPTQQQ